MRIPDDEFILLIRQGNQEALNMLFFRYKRAIDYITNKVFRNVKFCGIEEDDLKSIAMETFFIVVNCYDEYKSGFYPYWKFITERELYGEVRKFRSKSNRMLLDAVSFDNKVTEDDSSPFLCFYADPNEDVVKNYESNEKLLQLHDNCEKYFDGIEKLVVYKKMQGYSYSEIVDELKMDKKAVAKIMRKTHKFL